VLFRRFTSESLSVENAASWNNKYWNGSTCKATCSEAKIEIARFVDFFLLLPGAVRAHIRFRVAIARRVIIRTQVRFSRASLPYTFAAPVHMRYVGKDVSFGEPHFLHGNAWARVAISIFPCILFLFLQFFARLHSRFPPPPASSRDSTSAWFQYALVICNIDRYSRLLSPARRVHVGNTNRCWYPL